MQNQNKTGERVEKDPGRILQDLREYTDAHPVFARKMKERGVEFTPEWLRKRAERSAFAGLRVVRRLVPWIVEKEIVQRERAVLDAYTLLKDVIVEDKY